MFELHLGGVTTQFRFEACDLIRSRHNHCLILGVCDENTQGYLPNGVDSEVAIASGESHKDWHSVERILASALKLGLARDDMIVGVGGGVVCDLAAFAASVYNRGCRLILGPTTLLAMIDASFGGKTGFDFGGVKNLIGTFYAAEEVVIDLSSLATLSAREYRSGIAEAIKHAMLDDDELFSLLDARHDAVMSRDTGCVTQLIESSIRVKGNIVEADLRESGVRRHLNLGHTFGHALESASGFSVTHGEAVAWGIGRSLSLGLRLGITDPVFALKSVRLLERYGFSLAAADVDPELILRDIRRDKKRGSGELNFVVQKHLGETLVLAVDEPTIAEIIVADSILE